jgi:hypothetical protein
MADIQAFRGLRFDLSKVGSLSDVVAPPYDVISVEGCAELYAKSDFNVVRLILNRGDTLLPEQSVYGRAAEYLKDWKNDGILRADGVGTVYVYHQTFDVDGIEYTRRGFISRVRTMGCELVEMSLPRSLPFSAMFSIIDVEASTLFDSMIREGDTEGFNRWEQSFRAAQYVSAVDYVRVQRARSLLMKQFDDAIAEVDFIVNMNDLVQTNFTGHPSVVMPIDYRDRNSVRTPTPVILSGHLNDDERLLAFAEAFQAHVSAHQQHPELDTSLGLFNDQQLDVPKGEPKKATPEAK